MRDKFDERPEIDAAILAADEALDIEAINSGLAADPDYVIWCSEVEARESRERRAALVDVAPDSDQDC